MADQSYTKPAASTSLQPQQHNVMAMFAGSTVPGKFRRFTLLPVVSDPVSHAFTSSATANDIAKVRESRILVLLHLYFHSVFLCFVVLFNI